MTMEVVKSGVIDAIAQIGKQENIGDMENVFFSRCHSLKTKDTPK